MIPRKAKRDASEPAIVEALRASGFSVERMDKPVDLLIGFRGRTWLVECKSGTKGYGKSLNANQADFAAEWRGSEIIILHSEAEAIDWAAQVRREAA